MDEHPGPPADDAVEDKRAAVDQDRRAGELQLRLELAVPTCAGPQRASASSELVDCSDAARQAGRPSVSICPALFSSTRSRCSGGGWLPSVVEICPSTSTVIGAGRSRGSEVRREVGVEGEPHVAGLDDLGPGRRGEGPGGEEQQRERGKSTTRPHPVDEPRSARPGYG